MTWKGNHLQFCLILSENSFSNPRKMLLPCEAGHPARQPAPSMTSYTQHDKSRSAKQADPIKQATQSKTSYPAGQATSSKTSYPLPEKKTTQEDKLPKQEKLPNQSIDLILPNRSIHFIRPDRSIDLILRYRSTVFSYLIDQSMLSCLVDYYSTLESNLCKRL